MTEEMQPAGPAMDEGGQEGKRRNWIIIGVIVVVVLLCCCCLAGYAAYTYGDTILQTINNLQGLRLSRSFLG